MKERPIIFNTEMVRAILDGRKTQTRRLIKNDNECRFGAVGDRLWVRETFAVLGNEDGVPIDWNNTIVLDVENAAKIYRASCEIRDGDYGLWSIPDDAKAEGFDSVMAFRRTWENIYGSDSWDCNPWVWIIDFKVI